MRKILILMGIAIAMPIFSVNAAPLCDTVGGVPVNAGDPACYVENDCGSWRCMYVSCHGSQEGQTVSCGRSCELGHVEYTNNCGDTYCSNSYSTTGRYHNTCYYVTVDTWSECDENGTQSATIVTQHSITGTVCDNLNEETTRNCGMCNSSVAGVATGTAPGTSPQTQADLCSYSNTAPFPFPAVLNGNMWEWKCFGDSASTTENLVDGNGTVTSYSDDILCSAPNEEEAECNTAFTSSDPLLTTAPTEGDDLCSGGTYDPNSLTGGLTGPWSWNCLRIGNNPAHTPSITCNAECFRPELTIKPNPFPWPVDGSDVIVDVYVEPDGLCSNRYTCKTDDSNEVVPFSGSGTLEINIAQGAQSKTVLVMCTSADPIVDDPKIISKTVSGYCIARECNTQGTCQAIPVTSASASSSACTSTCSSNADCSDGRIIETRP